MFQTSLFELNDVELLIEGDLSRCEVKTSSDAWQAFVRAVNARMNGSDATDVQISACERPSKSIVAIWRESFSEKPLRFLAYQGSEGTAVVAAPAEESFATSALFEWTRWKAETQLVLTRQSRAAAIQAQVDAEPRTVDWSAPDPAVLDALEARIVAFEALDPDQETTHPVRERVYLAAAGAGIFDEAPRALDPWPRLRAWHRMATTMRAYIEDAPALMPEGATTILASHVSLDWFRLGPYVGEMVSPHSMLEFHLDDWLKEDRTEASEYSVISRNYSGEVKWRPGVGGVQQLCVTGDPVADVEWTGQATIFAALTTKAGHAVTGALLAARCAVESPDDWHAWTELGVALARLALTPPEENPLRIAKGALDAKGWAGAGRVCLSRAIAFEPEVEGYDFYTELMSELGEVDLDRCKSPIPYARLPEEVLAHSGPVRVGLLPASLRADLIDFLDRMSIAYTLTEDPGTASEEEDEEESDEEESDGENEEDESDDDEEDESDDDEEDESDDDEDDSGADEEEESDSEEDTPEVIVAWTNEALAGSPVRAALIGGYAAVARMIAGAAGLADAERAALEAFVKGAKSSGSPASALLTEGTKAVLAAVGAMEGEDAGIDALRAAIDALEDAMGPAIWGAYRGELRALGQQLVAVSRRSRFAVWRPEHDPEKIAALKRIEEMLG